LYPNALDLAKTLDYQTIDAMAEVTIKHRNKLHSPKESPSPPDEERAKYDNALEQALQDYNFNLGAIPQ
jgi:uncharacterized membrane protein YukC